MQLLQVTNQQVEQYSDTLEKLGIVRERSRLPRELHASVSQTMFIIVLNTHAAQILLEREPDRVRSPLVQV